MNGYAVILPEIILIAAACVLFLMGVSKNRDVRWMVPFVALAAMVVAFLVQVQGTTTTGALVDPSGTFRIAGMGQFIRILAAGVGIMFVLLSWPTDEQSTGNSALHLGADSGEYFALLLLSVSGIFLVAGANDLILLFLGIELASIPTYIMVSVSRPLPSAQEAGVKYFFLGAMAAALLLLGFSYLYGATGMIDLREMTKHFGAIRTSGLGAWTLFGAVVVIVALAFKLAAVPLHFYAGDVYEGAATPVTALLSFVPKTSGFVALIKILYMIGGGTWQVPPEITKLILVLAALTMTVGNFLGLMQHNVKRVLAYSSIAHSGYMLVGVAAILGGKSSDALAGVLFYLAAYGIMNVAAFGVLMLLPSHSSRPATSAETYEDLAGTGRDRLVLGLAMAVACFSLIGLPLTIGFFGKFFLIWPAFQAGQYWIIIVMLINAAVGAGYYLRIVGVMFLRPHHRESEHPSPPIRATPVAVAVAISTIATLTFGSFFPATQMLRSHTIQSATVDAEVHPPVATQAR